MFLMRVVGEIDVLTDTKCISAFPDNHSSAECAQLLRFELVRIVPFVVEHVDDIVVHNPVHVLQGVLCRILCVQIVVEFLLVSHVIPVQLLVFVHHVFVRRGRIKRRFVVFVTTYFH